MSFINMLWKMLDHEASAVVGWTGPLLAAPTPHMGTGLIPRGSTSDLAYCRWPGVEAGAADEGLYPWALEPTAETQRKLLTVGPGLKPGARMWDEAPQAMTPLH